MHSAQCKARLQIKDDEIVKEVNEHSHAPDSARADVLRIKNAIKQQAQSSQDTAQ